MEDGRIRKMAARVVRAFDEGMDRVSLFDGALELRYAERGGVIADDLCEDAFEALESGIFQRFTATRGDGAVRFVYMRVGAMDADIVAHVLEGKIAERGPSAVDEADVDLAFQVVSWKERGSRRQARQS